jgi:hypothetical protein
MNIICRRHAKMFRTHMEIHDFLIEIRFINIILLISFVSRQEADYWSLSWVQYSRETRWTSQLKILLTVCFVNAERLLAMMIPSVLSCLRWDTLNLDASIRSTTRAAQAMIRTILTKRSSPNESRRMRSKKFLRQWVPSREKDQFSFTVRTYWINMNPQFKIRNHWAFVTKVTALIMW